jgi:hypothetical protein
MPRRGLVGGGLVSGLVACLLLCRAGAGARKDPAPGYSPVAPASVLHAALASNLKQARDWLDDGDFASAAQAAQGLAALAWLYGQQGSDARWREKTAALRDACAALIASARRRDAGACAKAARSCAGLLAELAKTPPAPAKAPVKDFRPPGAARTWMLLMEGAYVDSKRATTPAELRRYAFEMAEEANAVSYLRAEPRWRKMTGEIRTAALLAAETAKKKDAGVARKALKAVYARCEACHQEYGR